VSQACQDSNTKQLQAGSFRSC